MSVTYRIDPESGVIETRCAGDVTFEEVLAHFDELRTIAEKPERLDVMVDLTELTSLPDSEQIQAVAEAAGGVELEWGACAIVASRDALYGMLRMFEVYAEKHFARTHVFRDRDEAEAWLAEARSKAP